MAAFLEKKVAVVSLLARLPAVSSRWSIRTVLTIVVLGGLLPAAIAAMALVYHQYREGREQLEHDTLQTARALQWAVDTHLLKVQAVAQTLALSDSVQRGHLEIFHSEARQVLAITDMTPNVVLRDRQGRQVMNALLDYGAPLPQAQPIPRFNEVFDEGRVVVSDIYLGLVTRQPIVSVTVPVYSGNQVRYALSLGISSATLSQILKTQALPEGWIVAALDSGGKIFARNLSPELYIGRTATSQLYESLMNNFEGFVYSHTQEGTPSLTVHTRSPLTGWSVAIGIPQQQLDAALMNKLRTLAAGIAASFGLGIFLAWLISRRIATSMRSLAYAAEALGRGEPTPPVFATHKEAQDVAAAMGQASQLLSAREKELAEAHRLARLGTWYWDIRSGEVKGSDLIAEIHGREVPSFSEQRGTVLTEASWDAVSLAMQEAVSLKRGYALELQGLHKDGHIVWIHAKAEPVLDENGDVIALRGTSQDITERKQAEEELREADKRKDEFLAMLAHELRNPLAPISAAAEIMQMGLSDPERLKQTSAVISRQVKHLAALVDDLLDVSRVTRGLATLQLQTVDANRIVADAIEQVRPQMAARHHKLTVHLSDTPVPVKGDAKRLVQIMVNLLNNAAKFTPEGGAIAVALKQHENHVELTVADNGIGMTPELQARAFDLFAQGERTPDRSQGGLGIGLALVKSLAELHGGSVSCESRGVGQGSRFTVRLPLAEEAVCEALIDDAGASYVPARKLKVLIVDDNVDAAATLAMLVESLGHEVLIEHRSDIALKRAQRARPDVFLLDIGLPEIDGKQLALRLREMPELAGAVFVAITGYGQEQERQSILQAGFRHHFTKPVNRKTLAGMLHAVAADSSIPMA